MHPSRVDTAGVAAVLGLSFVYLAPPPPPTPPPPAAATTTTSATAGGGSGGGSAGSSTTGGVGSGVGGGSAGVILSARALAQPPDVRFRTPSTSTGEKLVFVQEAIAAFLVVGTPLPYTHTPTESLPPLTCTQPLRYPSVP